MRAELWRAGKRRFVEALADYDEAIRLDPNRAAVYRNRGTAWMANEDHEKAIADFSTAIRLDPKDVLALRRRGRLWMAGKQHDRAIADFSAAIRLDPKDAGTYRNRGEAWLAEGRFDQAIDDLDQAIRLDPRWPSRTAAAAMPERQGAVRPGRRRLRPGHPPRPAFALLYRSADSRRLSLKEYDRAIADLSEAIRLDPQSAQARKRRGDAHRARNDDVHAIADYTEAIRLEPAQAGFYMDRGLAWNAPKEYVRAIADYDQAIRLEPKNTLAYRKRGAARRRQGSRPGHGRFRRGHPARPQGTRRLP